jgi:hypothetical protein
VKKCDALVFDMRGLKRYMDKCVALSVSGFELKEMISDRRSTIEDHGHMTEGQLLMIHRFAIKKNISD